MDLSNIVLFGDLDALERAHAAGAPVNAKDRDGVTALMAAAMTDKLDAAGFLLELGADARLQDRRGKTALHYAARQQCRPMIELLISRGADVNTPDAHGNLPIFDAVFKYKGTGDAVPLLIELGSDTQRENRHGVSAAGLARTIATSDVAKFFGS
jgi:hypothetical protein